MAPIVRAITLTLLLALMTFALAGCGYTLHGRVVEGHWSHMTVGDSPQDTAAGSGVRGAQISVYRDPGKLSQKLVASGTSSADGTFAIPLREAFGAGWLEEVWLVQASRQGYTSAEDHITLPIVSANKPLIIILTPGRSAPFAAPDDYHRDLERFR